MNISGTVRAIDLFRGLNRSLEREEEEARETDRGGGEESDGGRGGH
jgi:hypothetical protein